MKPKEIKFLRNWANKIEHEEEVSLLDTVNVASILEESHKTYSDIKSYYICSLAKAIKQFQNLEFQKNVFEVAVQAYCDERQKLAEALFGLSPEGLPLWSEDTNIIDVAIEEIKSLRSWKHESEQNAIERRFHD